ncbi:protein abrupt isoform X2 [Cylas formicarius]|uniref:protein abrupt isoform X2 n=1 Tax=Cylas formicarius TaxID=197179 RepID=UPI00295868D6|nr:protein abrupt isoform X2 [Cylas formicarius]
MGGDTSPEQQYSLRWNDFHSSILSSFRHLRDEEDFVDVTLACDGCSFTAHKVVLSACSPYFRRLLKANPCQHPIIILRDVQQKDMENLLRFMYNGEVNVGQENLTDFLKTAQMLQVRGLADVSAGAATQRLTTTSEEKISQPSTLPWNSDRPEALREEGLSPPPAKRARSSERDFSSQERAVSPASRNNNGDLPGSLLGQALEGGTNAIAKEAQSTGDDSSSSDTAISDHGDPVTPKTEPPDYPLLDEHNPFHTNGGLLDQTRPPSFPGALLGLQGLSGLIPGPSGMHGNTNDFVSRRSLDMMRVRATDPRPCPKCGKIYRSAHTLRTHLEDKHTICPGYRCVLCGTVAKSRNSLHSHMSRQHRGISTKDLPVLPMPAPFDPELASRLLAKAGVKISPAELRARASPTGPRRSDVKLDAKSAYSGAPSEAGSSICGDNDPEDLTVSRYGGLDYGMSPPLNQQNNFKPTRLNASGGQAVAVKSIDSLQHLSKEPYPAPLAPPGANLMNSALIDTYIQFITENSGMMAGMINPEQAAAAMQAAKIAQLNAMGMDKMAQQHFLEKIQQQNASDLMKRGTIDADVINNRIDKDGDEEGESSGAEDDYSDDEVEPEGVKAGE